jgi:D-alanyl-lipoteichoic acid acyltransferase DltB (MBOAT superfamily)
VPSLIFIGFAFAAALVFNLSSATMWRRVVLLATNLAFFCSFSTQPMAYVPFVGFLCLGYCGLTLIQAGPRQIAYFFIIVTLFCFIWLKRYTFLPEFILLPPGYLTIGLSYVFFRVMSLLIDAYDGKLSGTISPLSYVNYTLNFTSLVSGPIQRFQDYHRMEVEQRLPLDAVTIGLATERIVIGFFKVLVLSSLLLFEQRRSVAALGADQNWIERLREAIEVVVIYPLYLYCNFSGYTDFVIGVARLFRIILPENFNRPFASSNFIEFWNRWHMTLSSWLRSYVYTPFLVALMRRFPSAALEPLLGVSALFLTFFLVGVWHGQTSEFVFFGMLQGGGVAANKLYQILCEKILGRKVYRRLCANVLYRSFATGLTFSWFSFSLLWFWSNWREMATMASQVGGGELVVVWLTVIIGATFVLKTLEEVRRWMYSIHIGEAPLLQSRYLRTVTTTTIVIVIVIALVALNAPAPEIVYKTF